MPRSLATWSRTVLAAAGVAVAVVLLATPAAAHSTTGALVLVSIEPVAGDTTRVTVELRYDDEHPVQDAVVQLGGQRSDGVTLLPVTFAATDVPGRLVAEAALPGPDRWELRITSADPTAELRATYDPSDPAAAPATADGGEFSSSGGVSPLVWVAVGCAARRAVFAIAARRRAVRSD